MTSGKENLTSISGFVVLRHLLVNSQGFGFIRLYKNSQFCQGKFPKAPSPGTTRWEKGGEETQAGRLCICDRGLCPVSAAYPGRDRHGLLLSRCAGLGSAGSDGRMISCLRRVYLLGFSYHPHAAAAYRPAALRWVGGPVGHRSHRIPPWSNFSNTG